ncbi:MAG TPA: tRNA (guanosine(46)-N7)-methyltransferase TrmB [Chthoniobacterales bacterium]|nr:tRNA (guanosine(46)-N7)-methyltransferase TrmB [Chthoniobacterales bacterium]
MRTNKRTFPPAEIVPESWLAPLDLSLIFGRAAPLEVDLGCGDGTFLAALAQEQPARNFLGVERLAGRVRGACRKIGDGQLPNARVLRGGILDVLRALLSPNSVAVLHLLFPDPWPKRRHHQRRIVTEEFLRAALDVLEPGGELRIATDDAEYFARMERVCGAVSGFEICLPPGIPPLGQSTFENRFRARGAAIHRLTLQKRWRAAAASSVEGGMEPGAVSIR